MKIDYLRIFFYSFIVVIFAGIYYFQLNSAQIYANLGDKAYAKNNYQTAMNYYEKSFAKGNRNENIRENYVELLTKQNLSIENQEKFVKLIEVEKYDVAYWTAKHHLSKLNKEIEIEFPKNYIENATYNQKIVRWNNLPITYCYIGETIPQEYTSIIDLAFQVWENKTNKEITFKKTNDKNANIIIKFLDNQKIDMPSEGTKYVVAYTTPEISNNKLLKMEIDFYTKDAEGNSFTKNQIYNTSLHEIFHALGFMGHTYDKATIMYLANDSNYTKADAKRDLSIADINTAKLLYKIKPNITNATNNKNDKYLPFVAIGSSSDINYSKLKEAKLYIYNAPNLPNGYIDLAEAYLGLGEFDNAIKSLKKAYFLTENREIKYIIFYNLAISHFYNKEYQEAYNYIKKAQTIKDDKDLKSLLSEIYLKTGDTQKGIVELEKLVNENPETLEFSIRLANVYIEKRDYMKARKILKTFLKNNPKERNNPIFDSYGLLLF